MQSHYDRLGGEEVVRNVVNRFYDLMDEQPEYYAIRKLHPQDISGSRPMAGVYAAGHARFWYRGAFAASVGAGLCQDGGSYAQ